ncbi:hypothetical protein PAMP_010087 [Pampus punctatissimus]
MAESLQQIMKGQETFWLVVTHIGDPKAAFLLVFPFTYFINKRAGMAVIWVAAISEWLNLVFKCLLLSAAPFLLYVVMLVAVGLSRIFILAHFPHQVIAGSITGFILGVVLSRRVPEGRPLLFFFSFSMGLLLSALMLHAGLQQLGIDLSWSIALAKKWCSRAEWIRLDTAPFSSLTRDCGALLGLGLAQYWKPGGWSLPWAPRALSLAISSMGLYHVNRLPLPVRPQGLFYGLFFVKFVIVPQIVMVLVPGLVHLFTHKKKKD